MPVLSTFAGASLRTYGRGTEQVPAYVPQQAIVFYNVADITSATIPSGWSQYTGFSGKFVMGTATQSEVGSTATATGNVLVSITTSTSGSHAYFLNPSLRASFQYGNLGGAPQTTGRQAVATSGNHSHTGAYINCSQAMPNTVAISAIATTDQTLLVLPPNSIVFRKIKPTSSGYSAYRPSGNGFFYGASQRAWTDRTGLGTGSGDTTAAGVHNHLETNSFQYHGANSNWSSTSIHIDSGSHTHTISANLAATLRSKELKAWTSSQEEPIEYGMIIMYGGSLTNLPAGWRICNGTLGTPDMVGYFIGYTSAEIHDNYISTTTQVNIHNLSATIATSTWNHSHRGNSTAFYPHNGNHGNMDVSHAHTISGSTFSSFATDYAPAHTKIAFIQYKGI